MSRERVLTIVLVVLGLIFVGLVYPLRMFVRQELSGARIGAGESYRPDATDDLAIVSIQHRRVLACSLH
jgi:hypothetical protein